MDKPILFLDIDGVLNVFDNHDTGEPVTTGHLKKLIHGWPVQIPLHLKDTIRELREHYEIIWCTAWKGSAHSSWRYVLDLPHEPWPYLDYEQYKIVDVVKFMARNRPGRRWVWVDDYADTELDHIGWTRDHVDGLIVCTKCNEGLTPSIAHDLITYALGEQEEATTERSIG